MSENEEAMEAAMREVFGTWCVRAKRLPRKWVVEVYDLPRQLTWAQLHRLPGLLGTERIDIESYSECNGFGGSEVTPADYETGTRFTAHLPAKE